MTRVNRTAWLAGLVALAAGASEARAQFIPGQPAPAYSPYLNLARPGNPVLNYYGLVRPQLAFASGISGLQQYNLSGQTAAATDPNTGLPYTGHPVQFLNYGRYFRNYGSGRTGAVGVAVVSRPQGTGGVGPIGAQANVGGGAGARR